MLQLNTSLFFKQQIQVRFHEKMLRKQLRLLILLKNYTRREKS